MKIIQMKTETMALFTCLLLLAPLLSQAATMPLQGVTDQEVLFGQTAALTGASKDLGINMQTGILAAFEEINKKGGVAGRNLRLITRDDGYESELAAKNIRQLVDKDKVFSLVGGVGTPTSKAVVPIVAQSPLLYIGPFTGASFLRKTYPNTVINVRASYAQETHEMVLRLKKDLGIRRIGVLYQNDSYGLDGLNGIRKAVKTIKGVRIVSMGTYVRNTTAVKTALLNIQSGRPQAIIIIGSYSPTATFIRWAQKLGMKSTIFFSVSFVGVSPLAAQLRGSKAHVFVTQVVPFPHDSKSVLTKNYQRAMKSIHRTDRNGFISLEGYVVGRLVISALKKAGRELNYQSFTKAFKHVKNKFDIDGFQLSFDDLDDNQGSDRVFITRIYRNQIIPVKTLKFSRRTKK